LAEQLQRIAQEIEAGMGAGHPIDVRSFLSWYGAQRRGQNVVTRIREDLQINNLKTIPDFESAWLDGPINFELADRAEQIGDLPDLDVGADQGPALAENEALHPPEAHEIGDANWIARDPTQQISKLKAANQKVISVSPNDTIAVAVTKMLLHDYSQLPVMNDRTVKGVISWKSVATHLVLRRVGAEVRHAMVPAKEILASASIFEAIGIVAQHDFVLVRGAIQEISGIVTATDLSEQFHSLAEPFLLLSEIENHLRNMIGQHLSIDDFVAARDPAIEREITSVADLTFGEYLRICQTPASWQKFQIELDGVYFCERLEIVRQTRNDVMHFDPDGLEPERLRALREFVGALRTIRRV
jgi:CBS domain-containing protein